MAKVTVTRPGTPPPPTRASRSGGRGGAEPRKWYLEATVHLHDGTIGIERVERNNPRGRRTIDGWATKRLQHSAVDFIAVEPVVEPTHDRQAGYLKKSERPIEVIGLPGDSGPRTSGPTGSSCG